MMLTGLGDYVWKYVFVCWTGRVPYTSVSYTHLFMFSGEKVLVDLRCDNSLMKTMVDRFGEDVTTLAYDMTSFRVQTEVSASPTFFGWVFGFNGKVQILAPESLKEQYKQMLTKATEDMKENE